MLNQWENAELYYFKEENGYFLNGNKLLEGKYSIVNLNEALDAVGLDGWELVMKDKDKYGNKVYRMKRIIKCEG